MKIAFIGEAVSGFGGMETVISNVIHTFENSSPKINCGMFFFCRNDKMDKAWLKEIKYAQSFSNIKLSFLRRAKHVYNFSQWLKETSPD
ncbi:glycosyl transferase, partial [Salmonella enterica subsp. enterica serovar Derby]|nr:glycosyl transferase [Salmonella enterica subsp. enterica serovar Derby]